MEYYDGYSSTSEDDDEDGYRSTSEDDDEDDIWTTEDEDSRRDCRIFTVNFFGTEIITTLTSNPSVIRRWIYEILFFHRYRRHQLVVGLGVQWRPTGNFGSDDPAETLQLCVGTRCLIIQLSHSHSVPNILRRFLVDKQISFVGIRNYSDEKKLLRSRHQLSMSNTQNLGKIVASETGDRRHLGASMEILASYVLDLDGVKKDPSIGRSNWNAKYLTVEQVEYACVDAHVSFLIGKKFEAWRF
ncbi:3'-5' exonuclease domain [Macleaya cordata]|uniref:3'-5' exonuclease domain n=1 Tax=Macleaya cordata TaxID=56857 RepID=A0A200Q8V0_MACCD|nr:3'-5' exonuclease domain [Macleaya cordata]